MRHHTSKRSRLCSDRKRLGLVVENNADWGSRVQMNRPHSSLHWFSSTVLHCSPVSCLFRWSLHFSSSSLLDICSTLRILVIEMNWSITAASSILLTAHSDGGLPACTTERAASQTTIKPLNVWNWTMLACYFVLFFWDTSTVILMTFYVRQLHPKQFLAELLWRLNVPGAESQTVLHNMWMHLLHRSGFNMESLSLMGICVGTDRWRSEQIVIFFTTAQHHTKMLMSTVWVQQVLKQHWWPWRKRRRRRGGGGTEQQF